MAHFEVQLSGSYDREGLFTARYGLNPKERNNFHGKIRVRAAFLLANYTEKHQESGGNITQKSTLLKVRVDTRGN